MKRTLSRRSLGAGALCAVACLSLTLADHSRWTNVAARSAFTGFTPGNLVVSRSVYQGNASTVTVGQMLPGAVATTFSAAGTQTSGTVSSASGLAPGNLVRITSSGTSTNVTLQTVSGKNITWTPQLSAAVKKNDTCLPLASANGTYPGVWGNEAQDASFGVTSLILLDEMTPAGVLTGNTLQVNGMVTSFPSKSELGLHLSLDGSTVSFMGYFTSINMLDVSNANTPGHVDPTNPVPLTFQRAVGQVSASGLVQVTAVNSYSGNNGRAAVATQGTLFTAGNAGNGSGTPPVPIVNNTGVQSTPSGGSADMTVIGVQQGTPGSACGFQFGFSVSQVGVDPCDATVTGSTDKSGKDDNFRGLTMFGNTLYVTKGSGSNGIDTVYQVGDVGSVPTLVANAATTPITILPGLPTGFARNATKQNIYPFGLWFADANTLYVADEGDGKTPADGADNPYAGLQKWVRSGGQWSLAYVLQSGLNLGMPYHVTGYDPAFDPSPAGLRNLTGRVNQDGTVSIWAITSTVSALTDQGADPNQLVTITDVLTNQDASVAASEMFSVVRTAQFGEVLRGVSFTPGTIAPAWTVSALPAPNAKGWNNTNVNVSLMASVFDGTAQVVQSIEYALTGAQMGGQNTAGTQAAFSVTKEGTTTISYLAHGPDGAVSSTRTLSLMIDKTPPTITFTGNAGTYTVDQTVDIKCTATDSLSGIASSTCPGASGAAYTFGLGAHELDATATDVAGNTGTGSTTFTVIVTFDSLANLTEQFVSQHGIANSLTSKLSAAASAASRGNDSAKAGALGAYINELSAQSGKALTAAQATLLQQLAGAL
jgi:hypothetical protein